MSEQRPMPPAQPGAFQVPRPAAAQPAAPQTQQPNADSFAAMFQGQPAQSQNSEIPTSGVPLKEGFEIGLKGSEFFGFPPEQAPQSQAQPSGFEDFPTPPPPAPTEDEGEENENWGDDGGEDEGEDETQVTQQTAQPDPFASAFETPAAPAPVAQFPALQTPQGTPPPIQAAPAAAPQGKKKAHQILQENGSLVFDTKITADLSTVAKAQKVWDDLFKPYEDMTEAERYTRNRAGEILVRDRVTRFATAKLFAQAILDQGEPTESEPDDLFVTMQLGKDEAQAQQSDLGRTPPNPMMQECSNRMVGCTSRRLNHLQGTGKCVSQDCPCKGRCQAYVAIGGEATQTGETKSSAPNPATLHPAGSANVSGFSGGSAGEATNTVVPPQAGAVTGGVQPAVRGSGNVGQPNKPPAPAASASQPTQARVSSSPQPAAAQTQQGTAAQGGGSGSQPQNPGNNVQTQQQQVRVVSPSVGQEGTGQQSQTGQPQASNQAGSDRPSAGGQAEVERADSETQSAQEEEPIISGDLLGWIVKTGGREAGHADYWPSQTNAMKGEVAESRRDYITNRFVQFWEKATLKQVPLGGSFTLVSNTEEFDLKSTSYRVKLAADRVSNAIEAYATAPLSPEYGPELEKHLIDEVGIAAQDYVNAHRPLQPDQTDASWSEYLEYCEVFKDSGMVEGMLIHQFEEQQAQK